MTAAAFLPSSSAFSATDADVMTVYKDPNCGGCTLWADAYKKAGYRVEVVKERDLISLKTKGLLFARASIPFRFSPAGSTALSARSTCSSTVARNCT